jgi:hypothetical protein
MKPDKLPAVALFLLMAGLFVHTGRFLEKRPVTDWRDAPSDVSFEDVRSMNAAGVGDYAGPSGAIAPATAVGTPVSDPLFHLKTLESCSQKLGGDVSSMRTQFLRIPEMTRGHLFSRTPACGGCTGELSKANCTAMARCFYAAFDREKTMTQVETGGEDDEYRLASDARNAAALYKELTGKDVAYDDPQDASLSANWQRFMNSGASKFNPNDTQNERLKKSVQFARKHGNLTQTELIAEAIMAADGNITMGMGSLSLLLHDDRNISYIKGMTNSSGKNYYRFVGAYIGLHESEAIRSLGMMGAHGNIVGNPVVYGTVKTAGDFWDATKFALKYYGITPNSKAEPVDFGKTVETFGPKGNGNIVDKEHELLMGLNASLIYRGQADEIVVR